MDTASTNKLYKKLLRVAADSEGYGNDIMAMLTHYATDSVVPGVCTKCESFFESCEPDAEDNWCDECDAATVKSILVLAEVI